MCRYNIAINRGGAICCVSPTLIFRKYPCVLLPQSEAVLTDIYDFFNDLQQFECSWMDIIEIFYCCPNISVKPVLLKIYVGFRSNCYH